eukprot:1156235-Pelagomonas_calceolata.AAC.21
MECPLREQLKDARSALKPARLRTGMHIPMVAKRHTIVCTTSCTLSTKPYFRNFFQNANSPPVGMPKMVSCASMHQCVND